MVILVNLVDREARENLVLKGCKVIKEIRDQLVKLVKLVLRVRKGYRDEKGIVAIKGQWVHRDLKVHLV